MRQTMKTAITTDLTMLKVCGSGDGDGDGKFVCDTETPRSCMRIHLFISLLCLLEFLVLLRLTLERSCQALEGAGGICVEFVVAHVHDKACKCLYVLFTISL